MSGSIVLAAEACHALATHVARRRILASATVRTVQYKVPEPAVNASRRLCQVEGEVQAALVF